MGASVSHRVGPETERLYLRAFEPDDAPALFRMCSEPEVIRYVGPQQLFSVEETRKFIEDYPDFREHGFGRWACWLKSENKIIGFSGLKKLMDLGGAVDVGYRFFPEYWGKGFATESALVSIKFGFETLELPEIIGIVDPENPGSIHVLEKLGMVQDGRVTHAGLEGLRYVITRAHYDRRTTG
jgi:[ribosomal protein S5]-alanine N-acetyltransferase